MEPDLTRAVGRRILVVSVLEALTRKGMGVKSLVALAAGFFLLAGASLSSAAVSRGGKSAPVSSSAVRSAFWAGSLSGVHAYRAVHHLTALQAGGTSTPNPSASPTPTTSTNYPDPVTILGNAFSVLRQIRTVHSHETIDDRLVGAASLHIDVSLDAACKGPAMRGTSSATQSIEGTSQTSTIKQNFIQIKKKFWIKWSKTHKKWAQYKKTSISPFGAQLTFDHLFPLLCTGPAPAAFSEMVLDTDAVKNLVNQGPETFNGKAVWHIHFTDVRTMDNGQTLEIPNDILVDQAHFLPYVFTATITDPKETFTDRQELSKFGVKVTVKAPKIGSTKP